MSMRKVFAALAGRVRRLTAGLRDKPEVHVDDFVTEHFLLYNGLIGSTPENQREYKEVRNDIVQAINDGSAHVLAIALKLPPLWWEDRLEKIFTEINEVNRDGAIHCLAAPRPLDDITGDTTCLSHTNWQVRSNAARMLALLQAKERVPQLVELLNNSTSVVTRPAFCHVAYSLAKLGTDQARQALSTHLEQEEPWLGVDAAGALSYWNLAAVCADLMRAMLSGNVLDDYMAVAIARRHTVSEILEFNDDDIHEGAAEMVLGLLRALQGTFHAESGLHQQLEDAQDGINGLLNSKPTARRIVAAITLNKWLELNSSGAATSNKSFVRDLSNTGHYDVIKTRLKDPDLGNAENIGQFKHALALAAQFKLTELSEILVPLLTPEFPALPELMLCIAELGDERGAPVIAEMIEKRIQMDKRCAEPLSAHPVFEADQAESNFYWTALKALGSLPHKASLFILLRAVKDHAPDKREQALLSLQTILLSEELHKNHFQGNLEELLRERTSDPAVSVQVAALGGVAQHRLSSLIPEAIAGVFSKETLVQRKASETLVSLSENGHKAAVQQALEAILTKEQNGAMKNRLNKVLQLIK